MNLVVPVCTQRTKFDKACLLGVGDHDFIKHPSYVQYARLAQYKATDLIKRVQSGDIDYKGLIDDKVFAYICAGVASSDFAAPRLQAYFAAQ